MEGGANMENWDRHAESATVFNSMFEMLGVQGEAALFPEKQTNNG